MTEAFFVNEADAITPIWLTNVLSQAGVLPQGEVVAVEIEATDAFNSSTSALTLRYTDAAPVDAPNQLVLKRNTQEEWGMRAQKREVLFYQTVAAHPEHPQVIVPCYAASYDEQSGNSYLLLKNLTETHRQPVTRDEILVSGGGMPRVEYIEASIDTLACIQAFWWEHSLLKTEVARAGTWFVNEAPASRYKENRVQAWKKLRTTEQGATIPVEVCTGIEKWLELLPHYWEKRLAPRFSTGSKQTLLHGDAYFSNFLCPHELAGITYLIDWQGPEVHIGALDLVNLLATFWTRALRHEEQRELRALRHYYDRLTTHGVNDYSWEELLDDYRIGLIEWLFMPIWDADNGSSKDYWWPKMQCLFNAAMDWQCFEFMAR